MRFKAKLKKLYKNPKQFVKDSKLCRGFIKKEPMVFGDNKVGMPIGMVQSLSGVDYLQFTPSGNIIMPEIPIDDNSHLKTLILFNSKYIDFSSQIINFCYENYDFKPLRKAELLVYQYDEFKEFANYSEILQIIDAKNKERLAGYLNIMVIDDNPMFAMALRACHPDICVSFITQNDINDIDFRLIDYCILFSENFVNVKQNIGRNIYQTSSFRNVSIYIRKVIQNSLKREIDLFLPVVSSHTYQPNLITLSERSFSIFVKVSNIAIVNVSSHEELCSMFTNSITELFVKESIFLKYQDILEDNSKENLEKFFLLATQDGVKIEVEYE